MTPLMLAMIVLAASIHAGWNLLVKRSASAGDAYVGVYIVVSAFAYLPVALWLILDGGISWTWAVAACLAGTGLVQTLYSLGLQRAYAAADLSAVYPAARGSALVLASLGAFALLGEHPSAPGLMGMALVALGIVLIATNGRPSTLFRPEALTGLGWGLGLGVLISGYMLIDGYAVKRLGVHPLLMGWFATVGGTLFLTPPMLRDLPALHKNMRGHWRSAIIVGLISPFSYYLVLQAVRMGTPLSLAAPAREMSMMLATLLGALVLRETVGPGRWLGCACVTGGVLLLAMG